jgi:TonB family protein
LGLKQYLNTIIQYPEDARRNELSARVEAQFRIDKNGKVIDVTTTGATYKTFKDEITKVLMNMPAWTAAQYNDRGIASSMKVTIDFNLRRSEQIKVDANESDLTFYTEKRNREYAFGLNNIPAEPVYERSFTSLGWIACDRPIDVAKPADVIVQADGYTEVRAILKSTNTIVNGENCLGYTRFKNLPLNTDITLLSIRRIDGQTSYALLPLKTQKQNVISPVWIKADEDDLAALFKGLKNT